MHDKPSIEEIQAKVAELSGISMEAMLSRNRTEVVATARQIAIYLCCEIYPNANSFALGKQFNRSHSLIRERAKYALERMEVDPKFKAALLRCREDLKNNGCVKSGQ